jgi:hypothetical protein
MAFTDEQATSTMFAGGRRLAALNEAGYGKILPYRGISYLTARNFRAFCLEFCCARSRRYCGYFELDVRRQWTLHVKILAEETTYTRYYAVGQD